MKLKISIVALFLVGMFACTQRTCPTYTKDDIKKIETTEQEV
jgi:hypothetical protein